MAHEEQCHIFRIEDSTSHTSSLENLGRTSLNLPQIWRMALSHDGKFFACILRNAHQERGRGQLHILPLDELLENEGNGYVFFYHHRLV